jgi:hypothetical protein
MKKTSPERGKVVPLLLVFLVVILIALAAGYYFSLTRFDKRTGIIEDKFSAFEGKYEIFLSSLRSDVTAIEAYIEKKEGKSEEETKALLMMSALLKAKGEIISGRIALSQEDPEKALDFIDSAISVLKQAYELADEGKKSSIESLRLELATVKGIMEVNAFKAQQELDRLWRVIDNLAAETD